MSSVSTESLSRKPTRQELVRWIVDGTLSEVSFPYLECKANWRETSGQDISAIANHESLVGGWLVIGIDDRGRKVGHTRQWAHQMSATIGNQINEFLSPSYAVDNLLVEHHLDDYFILLEVCNPGYVTEWRGEAYKLAGTASARMNINERTALSLRLPGGDFSAKTWQGEIDGALVLDFAKKVKATRPDELPDNLSTINPLEVLRILGIDDKMTSRILFGDTEVRIAHYDANEDVISNKSKKGLYQILTDDFIDHIQSVTRKRGTILEGNTISVSEETPYPPKLLREIMVNATAHALYQRHWGEIIVDIHHDRVSVRNNATLEAQAFVEKWFAKKALVKNKLLMTMLRIAGLSDELGTGKMRVFRTAIEGGNREPIIEFTSHGNFGKWQITIFNDRQHQHLSKIVDQLHHQLPSANHARIATALILWHKHRWSKIIPRLDEYHQMIAKEVLDHKHTPVTIANDNLSLTPWVTVVLAGPIIKTFSPSEEREIFAQLKAYANKVSSDSSGIISAKNARAQIGLGNSQSEIVQLSNLFRNWQKRGLVQQAKRGHWQFL